MTAALTLPEIRPRVAIVADDPLRRAALAAIVAEGGYPVIEGIAEADVVLVDGSAEPPAHPAVARLGGGGDAAGMLPRQASAGQIIAAIAALAVGLSVRVREARTDGFSPLSDPGPLLTPREIEVLQALGQGLSNKAIARKLEISQHTVKFHVESLFRKLEVTSRAHAVVKGHALLSRTRLDV
jgi:DNA-binding NarL/FixJ family response regulator